MHCLWIQKSITILQSLFLRLYKIIVGGLGIGLERKCVSYQVCVLNSQSCQSNYFMSWVNALQELKTLNIYSSIV